MWPAGRRDLHWHLLPTREEAEALAEPYAGLLPPGLEAVPVDGMHITLLHAVGLARADADLDQLLTGATVIAGATEPFSLTFDRPAVGTVGVEVSGWPGTGFADLVDRLTRITVRSATVTAAPSRYPHISLAYASATAADVAGADIRARLARIPGPLSATVVADRLHLVDQWHDGTRIRWEPVAEIPLGASR